MGTRFIPIRCPMNPINVRFCNPNCHNRKSNLMKGKHKKDKQNRIAAVGRNILTNILHWVTYSYREYVQLNLVCTQFRQCLQAWQPPNMMVRYPYNFWRYKIPFFKIEVLYISGYINLFNIAKNFTNLKELTWDGKRQCYSNDLSPAFAMLSRLTLSHHAFVSFPYWNWSLTHLTLQHVKSVHAWQLVQITRILSLKILELYHIRVQNTFVPTLSKFCELNKLVIANCTFARSSHFQHLIAKVGNGEELSLSNVVVDDGNRPSWDQVYSVWDQVYSVWSHADTSDMSKLQLCIECPTTISWHQLHNDFPNLTEFTMDMPRYYGAFQWIYKTKYHNRATRLYRLYVMIQNKVPTLKRLTLIPYGLMDVGCKREFLLSPWNALRLNQSCRSLIHYVDQLKCKDYPVFKNKQCKC